MDCKVPPQRNQSSLIEHAAAVCEAGSGSDAWRATPFLRMYSAGMILPEMLSKACAGR